MRTKINCILKQDGVFKQLKQDVLERAQKA